MCIQDKMTINKTFIFAILMAFIGSSTGHAGQCNRIVCYMTNWAQYRRRPMKFFPENIDPKLCTHFVYAFATIRNNQLASSEWNDEITAYGKGLYARFNRVKTTNPAIKTLIAVGGWSMESLAFSETVSNDESRGILVKTASLFLRTRLFDGLDLHWQYPTLRAGGVPEDKHRFTQLVQELADAFRAESLKTGLNKLLLTASVGATKKIIDAAYDIVEIERHLDFINIMSYNFHGAWDTEVGHHSPLYADDDLSLSYAANYFLSLGVPASRLNIGLATFGRHVYLGSTKHEIGSEVKRPGNAGRYTKEEGFLAYFEVCQLLLNGGAVIREPKQHVPYYYKDRLWVGYDDAESLKEKVNYIKENNFGGIMIWTLDFDDFNGSECSEGKYPLLKAVNEECNRLV